MVDLSVFFSRLLPSVLGCSEPLARQATLDAAIEFCDRSLVLTVMLDPLLVSAGQAHYELDTPTGTTISQVLEVWYDQQRLSPTAYAEALAMGRPEGPPRSFTGQAIDDTFVISLLPTPALSRPNGLLARVALRPSRAANTVHDVLYERHAEAIVFGAMARLMAVPDQSFSDFANAAGARAQARVLANHARFESMHGRIQSSMSVKPRAF